MGKKMQTFSLEKTVARTVKFYEKDDPSVPEQLFCVKSGAPELSDILYPLPARKRDYTCFAKCGDILWLGAPNGVTRYDASAEHEVDKVMYFAADRYINDNDVKAIYCGSVSPENVWVLTETGVSNITVEYISGDEKAELLTKETHDYVDRHGMVTQRRLTVPREPASRVPYGHSDNSGSFTAGFAVGELCRYAVMKRELGAEHEKTVQARKSALRATESCLLLMYISGRGDGFVARTYVTTSEPVPDDGLFYRKQGNKAVCLPTTDSKKKGMAGMWIDASAPVPDRLAALYRSEGVTDDDIIYKGDTSSDEITHQYLLMYFAHEILGSEDPELDELIKTAAKNTLAHIIDHGCELYECNGKPTTWAKWSKSYFSGVLGWSDGCLNAAELLMYIKVVMHITGEKGRWLDTYNELIKDGYAELTALHDARFHISALINGCEQVEDLMYGDNMLATSAYWLLITLEEDPELKELYKRGYKGWNGTFRREHNPIYDIPYVLSCPEETVNTGMLEDWFRRFHITRLASSVSLSKRSDIPVRLRYGGEKEISTLLTPDEQFVSKYDRNPYKFADTDNHDGLCLLESCYVYTCAYWLGRYYGIIE